MAESKNSISVERQFIDRVWERIRGDYGAIITLRRALTRHQPELQYRATPIPYLPKEIGDDQRYMFVAALMAANHQQPPR